MLLGREQVELLAERLVEGAEQRRDRVEQVALLAEQFVDRSEQPSNVEIVASRCIFFRQTTREPGSLDRGQRRGAWCSPERLSCPDQNMENEHEYDKQH